MSAIDRFRGENKQNAGIDELFEGLDPDDTTTASNILSEVISRVGGAYAQHTAGAEGAAATLAAKQARKAAAIAAADAFTETDANGPLHKKAETLDRAATAAEQKAAFLANPTAGSSAASGGATIPKHAAATDTATAPKSGIAAMMTPKNMAIGAVSIAAAIAGIWYVKGKK